MIVDLNRASAAPSGRGLRWWLLLVALVLAVSSALLLRQGTHNATLTSSVAAPASASASPPESAAPESAAPGSAAPESATLAPPTTPPSPPSVAPAPDPAHLLQMPGPVPAHGAKTFRYAAGSARILGTAGPLRRFRVAVENGSGEDVETVADQVEATLGDKRSWTGGATLRLQRVPAGGRYDFTVYLATRDTAAEMCRRGGIDIAVQGRPYTSCRTTGKSIINLDRWRLSAVPYLAAKVPLATYREYVINHEVGHELGHHHQGCPHPGGPAPVMLQQTLTVRGCVPYAWPRRGSAFLSGPPV